MAFKKPETFEGLTLDELRSLNDEALAEGRAIIAKEGDLTDQDLVDAEALMAASQEIETEIESREQAEADRTARIEALRNGLAEAPAEDRREEDAPEEDDGADDDSGDGDAEVEEDDADADAKKEVVVASAPTRTVSRAARKAPPAEAPQPEPQDEVDPYAVTLVASVDVPGYAASAELADMLEVSKAFQARSKGFAGGEARGKVKNLIAPGVYGLSDEARRYGVAQIKKPDNEFAIDDRMDAQDQYDMIMAAAKEARLPGGNLVAAGGWCAPSEQIYGFCDLETVTGLLSLPEIQARRGGVSFTKGPDYAALAATWGFLQTEAQAISGTVKTCYEVTCPTWTETRLDVVGFCITSPVLTQAAFPELVNRVLQIGAVAHAHKVNASIISRISTALGAAIDWAEQGAAKAASTSEILDAAELQAERLRYTYSLAPGATIEAIFPVWARGAIRADVGRRLNIDNPLNVSDAAIDAWFRVRGINVQYVYDYQPLGTGAAGTAGGTATWTNWPTTLEFMMYTAGAFTKLTKPVIDLDTIYDAQQLSTNVYTAAFYEEGIAIINTCGGGVKVSVAINRNGSTGYPAVGAGTGVTIP